MKTDETTRFVREHYDGVSRLYRAFWGEHIHHGYWEADEPLEVAQRQLIERLALQAGIERGSRVLDVGCGLGGSSLWLAENLDCEVIGLTLSPVQAKSATARAARRNLSGRVRFRVHDANDLSAVPTGFDAVWVIECSEHLRDKARFVAESARLLKPGGALAVCAWLDASSTEAGRRRIADICEAMICPALVRYDEYMAWMADAGFGLTEGRDVSRFVDRTWDLAVGILQRRAVRAILPLLDGRTRRFARSFEWMQAAFHERSLGYGMFTGRKG